MGNVDFKKVVYAGIAGSAAMTVYMLMAPMMGFTKIDMGDMLGTMNPMMPMPYLMGWVMHFIIGIILTWIYAAFLINSLPSDGWKRGMIYSLIPWAVMQVIIMPMLMGQPMLSGGDMMMLMGTILSHLAYGGVMGAVYGNAGTPQAAAAAAPAEPAPSPEPESAPTEPEPAPEPEPETPAETETPSEPTSEEDSESDAGDESEEKTE